MNGTCRMVAYLFPKKQQVEKHSKNQPFPKPRNLTKPYITQQIEWYLSKEYC